ncbi:phytoene/squalene synthase family protein [Flavihumibacter sp. ZG627]|uniref:phytoene/squalene synthase family protein n=1 Tax=Flavihumibacter sp. ZG627 TaxID=1463156 RepID=UPI00057D2CD6|nr:phytoene/squalene synthase family protein [Flavihumibacter sp. ZG627]KIC92319.1 phytoene synthase [Flavihumibacter sp. ZG627]
MMQLFHTVSEVCSRVTTERYSTSFSSAIKLLHHDLRQPIFNIYGLVRFADEIVDTFHDHDKSLLLAEFKQQTYDAIERKISLNPILHSFQLTVNAYNIDHSLIDAFFRSMEMDLDKKAYDHQGYIDYIYGSAEVVGLMCLYVFCEGDRQLYDKLKGSARSLGAAFQKVNFLRDLNADFKQLDRVYFPGCDFTNFTDCDKTKIEADIQADFDEAYNGIMQLPVKARFGVYVAYKYYLSLFRRIKRIKPARIMQERVRVPDYRKAAIVLRAGVKQQLGMM